MDLRFLLSSRIIQQQNIYSAMKNNNNTVSYLISQAAFSNIGQLLRLLDSDDMQALKSQQEVVKDLKLILTDQYATSALTHVLAVKLIKEMFLLSREPIISLIENELLPALQKIALYRVQAGSEKGITYFNSTKQFSNSDQKNKQILKTLGNQFVLFTLQSIKTWADWVPFNSEGQPSQFYLVYERLTKKNVEFPSEKYIYKEVDRQRFHKTYKMEFFNSESSFEQSVMNEENYQALVHKQIAQCEQISNSLRFELQPQREQNNEKKIRHIIERASIFYHEQSEKIIRQLQYNRSSNNLSTDNYINTMKQKRAHFGKLLEDYDLLNNRKIQYTTFYNNYGSHYSYNTSLNQTPKEGFFKKEGYLEIEREEIDISEEVLKVPKKRAINLGPGGSMNIDNSKRSKFDPESISIVDKVEKNQKIDREKEQLRLQLEVLKQNYQKRFDEQKRNYDRLLEQEHSKNEQRIQQLKKLINSGTKESKIQLQKRFEQENQAYKKRFEELRRECLRKQTLLLECQQQVNVLTSQVKEYKRQLYQRDSQVKSLKIELQKIRNQNQYYLDELGKTSRNPQEITSRFKVEINQYETKSARSENNFNDTKILQKKIDNLQDEKQMLKQQLDIERKKNYKIFETELKQAKEENTKLKQRILEKQQKQKKILLKLDLLEIENMKLQQTVKMKHNIAESLKKQNEWISKMYQPSSVEVVKKIQDYVPKKKVASDKELVSNRPSIKYYLDDCIEGDTYYQQLSKEFRIRFRRACLRKKQLLFKQTHLEIGTIVERKAIDHLSLAVFLTNYSMKDIKWLKLKVLNNTTNKIICESTDFDTITQGEQQKVYIDIRVQSYPIGPVILKVSYADDTIQKTFQLLLPVSIFKLVTAKARNQQLAADSKVLTFASENKVIKDIESLRQLFQDVPLITQNRLRLTMTHEHTNTIFALEISKGNDNIELRYKLTEGWNEIVEYYVKTLRCLFQK